jgi:hypothetical protein
MRIKDHIQYGLFECLPKVWEKKPQLLNGSAKQTTYEGAVRGMPVKAAKYEV